MNKQFELKHYVVGLAILSAVAAQLSGLKGTWSEALTPAFVGGLLGQIVIATTALFVGAPKDKPDA